MKRLACLALCCTMLFALCGCGSMFSEEYVVVGDYTPPAPISDSGEGRITVTDLYGLRLALLGLVSDGVRESSIAFDADYEGEISEDMASACWQVRTQDALCAYCVENISYDLTKIVNYTEARISIRYSDAVCAPEEVLRRTYSSGMDELVREMMAEGKTRLAVLISSSYTGEEGMEELVRNAYREEPILSPRAPEISVMMLSGSGTQRLYEIDLDYGMEEAERQRRLEELHALSPFEGMEITGLDEAHRALAATLWLSEHCVYDPEGNSDLYSALIRGCADEEGMAFAFVHLCTLLGLDCRMVYGQRSWEDYCWNIVSVDGDYYHVAPAVCAGGDLDGGFLIRDELMWEDCRWDVSAYPPCTGELSWYFLQVQDGLIEPEPPAEEETAEEAGLSGEETPQEGIIEADGEDALPAGEEEEINP